ncbi:MAG: sulfatase-like hydrolase/transferase [Burkholderiaceae bacterium]|nr:sulfatase-like hydrolase/transferase [Burkholderiaceae bacterium]
MTHSDVWIARARAVLPVLLALALLNTLLSMRNWWPTPAVLPDLRLSPEAVGLWLLLLAGVLWRGRLSRVALTVLSLLALLLVLGRYFAVTAPALFGRPVNLYWDGQQIPTFLWVSAREYPLWVSFAAVGLTVAVLATLFFSLRWALRTLAEIAAPYALRARWTWLPTAVATLGVAMHLAGTWPSFTWHWVTDSVTPTYARQAVLLATALSGQATRVLPPSPALDTAMRDPRQALAALRGRDVNLVFLESYGAMVYDDPRVAPPLARARAAFGDDITASGRHVASAFVRAATFAGASELSHLSLLSGIDLSDPLRHDLLLTTDRPTLARLFSRAGYQSFGVYPALSWDWAESRFYGFDRFLDGRDLDYRGPPLGYWKIPDQYSFAKLHALHPAAAPSPPRLLFFPTITTHLPFGPVPPYQADWDRLLGTDPFGADESRRLLTSYVDWLDMRPNYVGMFEYTYRWLGGWLRRPEPREMVWLLVGDHQPAASVSGEGASWDVPVHVITRDPDLLARFVAQGFTPGLEPVRAPLGGMHDLTTMLLHAFAAPAAAAGAAAAGSSAASAPLR